LRHSDLNSPLNNDQLEVGQSAPNVWGIQTWTAAQQWSSRGQEGSLAPATL